VAKAVGDVGDQALGFSELFQDSFHGLDVRHLAVAPEIVNRCGVEVLASRPRGQSPSYSRPNRSR
jgi:hypothetical protein